MIKDKRNLLFIGLSIIGGVLVAFSFFKILTIIPSVPSNPIIQSMGVKKPIVMGFVPYWLVNKVKPGSLTKLNRVTYFGLTINVDGTLVKLTNPQETEPGWHILNTDKFSSSIKSSFLHPFDKSLLLHLSNEASISALLTEPARHANNMINDAEPIMKKYAFTDLNLDIESFRVASASAQAQMSAFLKEVKKQLVERQLGTLTTELTVASLVKNHLLQPEVVGEVSDHVVLMAYDFHYSGSVVSGPVAPVGGAKEKWEYDVVESVKLAMQAIPAEKILLGIPLYGYEWETLSYEPESAVIPGTGKTATPLRLDEIKKNCNDCVVKRDAVSGSPYLILPPSGDSAIQQIYFEDTVSIQKKIELAQQYKLGGVAFWAIGYENDELLLPLKDLLNSN